MMTKTINGEKVKITRHGYLYINGQKINQTKLNPFYQAVELVDDTQVLDLIGIWVSRNFLMVNSI